MLIHCFRVDLSMCFRTVRRWSNATYRHLSVKYLWNYGQLIWTPSAILWYAICLIIHSSFTHFTWNDFTFLVFLRFLFCRWLLFVRNTRNSNIWMRKQFRQTVFPKVVATNSYRFVVFSQIGNESLLLYNSFLQSGCIAQRKRNTVRRKVE